MLLRFGGVKGIEQIQLMSRCSRAWIIHPDHALPGETKAATVLLCSLETPLAIALP